MGDVDKMGDATTRVEGPSTGGAPESRGYDAAMTDVLRATERVRALEEIVRLARDPHEAPARGMTKEQYEVFNKFIEDVVVPAKEESWRAASMDGEAMRNHVLYGDRRRGDVAASFHLALAGVARISLRIVLTLTVVKVALDGWLDRILRRKPATVDAEALTLLESLLKEYEAHFRIVQTGGVSSSEWDADSRRTERTEWLMKTRPWEAFPEIEKSNQEVKAANRLSQMHANAMLDCISRGEKLRIPDGGAVAALKLAALAWIRIFNLFQEEWRLIDEEDIFEERIAERYRGLVAQHRECARVAQENLLKGTVLASIRLGIGLFEHDTTARSADWPPLVATQLPGWTTYTDEALGFSCHIPVDWQAFTVEAETETGSPAQAVRFLPPPAGSLKAANIGVVRMPMPQPLYLVTTDEVVRELNFSVTSKGFIPDSPAQPIEISGAPAAWLSHDMPASDGSYTLRAYLAVIGGPGPAYAVQVYGLLKDDAELRRMFETVCASFRLLDR